MDLICRAHQVVEDGYEFFSKRQLVTLFSAPNYCGEFDNAGAMMSVDESLLCSFQVSYDLLILIRQSLTMISPADLETSREKAKVRLRWHERRRSRHSSAKAKEEIKESIRASPSAAGSGGDKPFTNLIHSALMTSILPTTPAASPSGSTKTMNDRGTPHPH